MFKLYIIAVTLALASAAPKARPTFSSYSGLAVPSIEAPIVSSSVVAAAPSVVAAPLAAPAAVGVGAVVPSYSAYSAPVVSSYAPAAYSAPVVPSYAPAAYSAPVVPSYAPAAYSAPVVPSYAPAVYSAPIVSRPVYSSYVAPAVDYGSNYVAPISSGYAASYGYDSALC